MEKRTVKYLIVALSVSLLIILTLAGYIIYDKIIDNKRETTDDTKISNEIEMSEEELKDKAEIKEKINIEEEDTNVMTTLVGDYGRCYGTKCNGLLITKGDKDEYKYTFYQPNAGGFRTAYVIKLDKISDSKYEITGYYPATSSDSMVGEQPAREETITVDTSKLSSKILIVNGSEYEAITNRDKFFESKRQETFDEVNKIVGDWGSCQDSKCNGIEITVNDRIYKYTFYQPNAGGFRTASVNTYPQKVADNKYELTGYYPATSNDSIYGEQPAREETITIDLSKISSNILIVNDREYEKITNRDEFYNSYNS